MNTPHWSTRPVAGLGLVNKDFVAVAESVERDGKAEARHFFEQVGGPVPVALTAMARLGLDSPPAFLGVVGDDHHGEHLAALLEEEGANVRHLKRDGHTSKSLVLLDARDGTRTLANWSGGLPTVLPFTPEQEAVLAAVGLLHVDGRDLDACLAAAEIVRAAGGRVSIDLGTMRPGREALLARCDLCLASRKGGAGAFPDVARDPLAQVSRFLELGAEAAGVTLAHEGVAVGSREMAGPVRIPAFVPPGPVVDTCGAGDTFHGAFVWAYRSGRSAVEAADFAQAAVCLKITRLGNRAGLPTRAQVEEFLASDPPRQARP